MSMTLQEIEKQALELTAEDQLDLAEKLIANVSRYPDPEIEAAWLREVQRRVQDIDEGRVELLDGHEVIRRIRERLDERRRSV